MKISFPTMAAAIALQLIFVSPVLADDKQVDKRVAADSADTPAKFAQVMTELHQEMGPNGRYEFISPGDKSKAEADIQAMSAMLNKAGSVAAMSQTDKVQLFNTQEHLNGVLTHSDRNRLVCEHRPQIGSNIAVTSCKTVAELEKMRRDGQKMAMDGESIGWNCRGSKAGTGCAPGPKGNANGF